MEDRSVAGQWEEDLLCGGVDSQIATLVERKSGFPKLVKVKTKSPTDLAAALSREVAAIPLILRKTMTWDRGFEMAKHRDFTKASQMQSSSAILKVLGNEAQMKIRMDCFVSTSLRARLSRM